MAPSQLKQLKASLRESGLVGPRQKKKKARNSNGKDQQNGARSGQNGNQSYVQRQAALQEIRASFNPFEYKHARGQKFAVTTAATLSGKNGAGATKISRPGVTKSLGEEARRATLLPEMQRRHKTGGIVDRRIGEDDPNMTPEERMLQRMTRESQRQKRTTLFNLEDAEDDEQLTHLGQALLGDSNGLSAHDDFDENEVERSGDEGDDGEERARRKRRRLSPTTIQQLEASTAEAEPERKKTKKEVMEEVIAKSKFYKAERQQAKEDDDDVREKLDKGLPDLLAVLRRPRAPIEVPTAEEDPLAGMNPERAALLKDEARAAQDKEYDQRLRSMAQDIRAQPTDRTKTEEEIAAAEAERLRELEQERLRRMRGEDESEEDTTAEDGDNEFRGGDEDIPDHAEEFGFTDSAKRPELDVEDEDDFIIDEDLVASGSDIDSDFSDLSDENVDGDRNRPEQEDDDEEFLRDVLGESGPTEDANSQHKSTRNNTLAFTYECPQTHAQLNALLKEVPMADYPTIVQRIRTLYNPKLKGENKEKLGNFSRALIDHLSFMAAEHPPLFVVETLIRHVHSLSRTFPDIVAHAMRAHLLKMHQAGTLHAGDLIILTAVGSIYPTSDHFHQVVTPAMTIMARWLELTRPRTEEDHVQGAYLVALCCKYHHFSKRYVPEALHFTHAALRSSPPPSTALAKRHADNVVTMTELWAQKSAFIEMVSPRILAALTTHRQTRAVNRINAAISQARLHRRPLQLHHHRPLPIKTSIPKFEDSFNPDKHYDPDRERQDASKLRAEYKREHKAVLRELKKDASFMAREQLREKKDKDRAYEAKQRRLIAEIQGEEGAEKNAYEREKRARRGKR